MANYPGVRDFTGGDTLLASHLDEIWTAFQALQPVGSYAYIVSASSSSENFINAAWLECNGASVLRATYSSLNTVLSGLSYPFGTADGTHFTLPDLRGRAPWGVGTHTNAGLGDSDGVAVASRQPAHTHTSSSLTVTGAPAVGSLALPNHVHTQTLTTTSGGASSAPGFGFGNPKDTSTDVTSNPTSNPAITGSPAVGSLDVGGTAGSGMSGSDAVAHLFAGCWFIKAVT